MVPKPPGLKITFSEKEHPHNRRRRIHWLAPMRAAAARGGVERYGRGRPERFLLAGDQAGEPRGGAAVRGHKFPRGGYTMRRRAASRVRGERDPRRGASRCEGGCAALPEGTKALYRN